VLGRWRDWNRKVWTKREQGKVGFRRGGLKKPPSFTKVSYLRMVLAPGGVSNMSLFGKKK